jgi:hypothetical protein
MSHVSSLIFFKRVADPQISGISEKSAGIVVVLVRGLPHIILKCACGNARFSGKVCKKLHAAGAAQRVSASSGWHGPSCLTG